MRSFPSFPSLSSCALVVAMLASRGAAFADTKDTKVVVKPAKSLAECTSFDQVDRDETTIALTIHNRCSIPIDCVISWRLVCAPESKTRRTVHAGSAKLSLMASTSDASDASASACKDDSWLLDQVRWSCRPNKD